MAEDYAAVFEEQMKAFEKERSTLKKNHDEKTEKLETELKSIKEQFSKSNAELLVSQEHVKQSGWPLVWRIFLSDNFDFQNRQWEP